MEKALDLNPNSPFSHLPPPLAIDLANHAKARNIVVRPGSLAAYDQLDTDTQGDADKADKPEQSDDENR